MKKDKIGNSCVMAIDSLNAARHMINTAIAALRYATDTPTTESEHIRTNSLGTAVMDIESAIGRLASIEDFVRELREQAFDAMTPAGKSAHTEDE